MNTDEKKNEVSRELGTLFDQSMTYLAVILWIIDKKTGEKHWNYLDVAVSSACFILVVLCMFIIIFCVSMICWKINSKEVYYSKKMRKSNCRLTMTIVFQVSITCFMMFIPLGLLMICPMFGIEIANLKNILTASIVFYPAVEAIITIFIIGDFRNALFCRKPGPRNLQNVKSSGKSMETKF
ncbi:unnamed protein product [Caenorhabditis angaria]|uniref:7TM GPCR serpentine receptor class x (Srx) domain-containing protein n=1 Tax=Caenorhabditis angaria TaxID=860376 RepID=A0A9P1J0M6_9PELO|nr:unnamed protein product [Caenorhabditis angaria]